MNKLNEKAIEEEKKIIGDLQKKLVIKISFVSSHASGALALAFRRGMDYGKNKTIKRVVAVANEIRKENHGWADCGKDVALNHLVKKMKGEKTND